MKKSPSRLLMMIVLGLLITSCSEQNNSIISELENKSWELAAIRKSVPIKGSLINIEFKDGEVHGSSGCNSYFGRYEIKGNEISIGMLASTEMACLDPEGLMVQEQDYLSFLAEVVSISIEDGQLILRKAVQEQLTFTTSPHG